jgi:hypothetical protein
MSLSPEIQVSDPHPEPTMFGVLKQPAKPLTHARVSAPRLNSKSTRSSPEYENPDLTLPSVSSF